MSNYKCNLCNYRCEAGIMRNYPCDPIIEESDKEYTNNEKENKKDTNYPSSTMG